MKLKTTIRIANPEEGGKKYTSGKRALEYLNMGRAILTDNGELFFITRKRAEECREVQNSQFHWSGRESGKTLGNTGMQVMQAERTMRR